MAKPMKTLELHYPMIQFLIIMLMRYWEPAFTKATLNYICQITVFLGSESFL